jgi:hypothetical protein
MQGKPVISPPAKQASNGPHCKHAQQAIDWAQFGWFEFH